MHNSNDIVAYVATGVSVAAAAVEPSGLQIANEIATLCVSVVGIISGALSAAYLIKNWKRRK